ncbi:helix-turn-helix transcriptional regulator [Chitinophaga sancti]|uniref:helix-turn-helix transcriptional regulator n=1 Tax=Chitinophaga sancti TaxID=1004 RepID=UPI002A74DEE6|nr:helix-turn-helix transcriptional regulator [Chitinophaga sancti]WPQ63726.1 helix-turn-helix transcriptional regulator [Chitinophaga sancti]
MRFDKVSPTAALAPYIKYYVIAENTLAEEYTIFPSTSLVIGFQYRGLLSLVQPTYVTPLSISGISGMTNSFKVFKNSPDIGTVLVYFTETGLLHFTASPANELFNQSIGIDYIFPPLKVREAEERLAMATNDVERIAVMNRFFLSLLRQISMDKLVMEAVRLIYATKGTIKIKALQDQLFISQSPFEKRFRKLVGTSSKKFASIVRFNAVMEGLGTAWSLTEICYEYGFFDQAHFIKDFKQFTGKTPEELR